MSVVPNTAQNVDNSDKNLLKQIWWEIIQGSVGVKDNPHYYNYDYPHNYKSGNDIVNDTLVDADGGDYFNNNTFMEYLEGLMASQGQEAVENRLFNAQEAEKARQFSASEAQKNRDWQEYMSSSAWQRTVTDLQKSGLNPILAFQQGSATTPSGGSAQSFSGSVNNTGGDTLSSVLNSVANLVSSASDVASLILKIPTGKTSVRGFG